MIAKIEITVKVQDASRDGYRDPSGYESIELYCVDENDVLHLLDGVVNALARVCFVRLRTAREHEALRLAEDALINDR